MPDLLRERFDALRNAVEGTDVGGLHDVRVRRIRRTRARVAAASAATVAALAIAGVVVLPDLGGGNATTSGADALSDSAGDVAADRAESDEEIAVEQVPDEPLSATLALTPDSLLTWPDIQAVGETGPGTNIESPSLAFPLLCGASSLADQYSRPVMVFSAGWGLSDGTLVQSGLLYETAQRATDALARLVGDSQACPVVDEMTSIVGTGADTSVGDEIAFFDLTMDYSGTGGVEEPDNDGLPGDVRTNAVSVTRIGNVLVELELLPYGPNVLAAGERSRVLATAAVNRVIAFG